MIITALVIVFFATVATGPAGMEYLSRRRQLREKPAAKVLPFPYPKGHPRSLK